MLRKIAFVAPAAVMAVSLTGCMGIGDSGGKDDNGGVALSAAQVMNKAANNTASADSYKVAMRMTMTGKMGGKQRAVNLAGDGQFRTKPSTAMAFKFSKMDMGAGQQLPGGMETRLVGRNMFIKSPMLQKLTGGKPWVKFSFDQLGKKSGMNFDQLVQRAQNQADPATFTKMFTASKDVKEVGNQTVRGVKTTHYTGTVDMTKALSKIGGKQKKYMKSQLSSMKNVKFDLFSDSQQLPRKIVLHGKAQSMKYSTTAYYSDFGEPVHIAAPPAAQTSDGSKLGKSMGAH